MVYMEVFWFLLLPYISYCKSRISTCIKVSMFQIPVDLYLLKNMCKCNILSVALSAAHKGGSLGIWGRDEMHPEGNVEK